jgi:hypothetical protein
MLRPAYLCAASEREMPPIVLGFERCRSSASFCLRRASATYSRSPAPPALPAGGFLLFPAGSPPDRSVLPGPVPGRTEFR